MKQILLTAFLFALISTTAQAQFPDNITVLDVKLNNTKTLSGSLSEGKFIDLRFGLRGSVGCFTDKEKNFFNGHHVLYAFKVPANTKVLVEAHTRGDVSLYGYMIDADRYDVPPTVQNVYKSACANSHKGAGEMDRIMLKAGDSDTHVIVGVTGIDEADSGAFNLKVTTRQ